MNDHSAPATAYRHRVSYLYNDQPQQRELEYDQAQLPPEVAALKLLEIHFGATEHARLVPPADASPQEVMDQAQLMGITFIELQQQGRVIGSGQGAADSASPEWPLHAPSDALPLNERGFDPGKDPLDALGHGKGGR
jgi:hypothetical protein